MKRFSITTRWQRIGMAVISSLLLCAALVLPFLHHFSPVHASAETARSAASFVDTIGVNTHLSYTDTVYSHYNDILKPRLQELGIHHIRDGFFPVANTDFEGKLKDLAASGISADLIADPRSLTPGQAEDAIKRIGSAITSVEGPNEYDLSGKSTWASDVRTYQQQLYQTIKGDAATTNMPVFGPSLTSGGAYSAVGDLSNSVDAVNMHNYFGGRNPGNLGYGDGGYGSLAYNTRVASVYAPNKGFVTTETGYYNSPSSNQGVPEWTSGRYIPRTYLEEFNNGIPHTYTYELINTWNDANNPEANYGLLRNDGSEKPAFVSLKNITSLLQDPNSTFTPSALDYTLSGNTNNVHHTLLQKSDGSFYLMMWIEAPSFDVNAQQPIPVADQAVTVQLNTPMGGGTVYTLDDQGNMASNAATITNNQLNLSVSDRVSIVKLTGSAIGGNSGNGGTSGTTLFSTDFEQNAPQPTWNDTVDFSRNVSGVCCGLTHAESSTRQEIAHSGSTALMYSGSATDANESNAYNKIFDLRSQNITIGANTTLSYWIFPQQTDLTSGNNSTSVAIDIIFTDGSALRDSGAVDQYGVQVHPQFQGQGGHLTPNAWNHVISIIGQHVAGKTIDHLLVGYDHAGSIGGYRGYIDDIQMTN